MRRAVFLLLLVLPLLATRGHDPFPKDAFRSPLGIPLVMAGNFAEMRPNHFHSGLDLKTNNAEGYNIYAVADGWVSRIVVSPSGFGNALYLAHPNGYTTVYAHLSHFSEAIDAYVKRMQYRNQSFRLDTALRPEVFPVNQGDVVAFSGNSGSSSGPHLHFEVRDSGTQNPLNPLLFGFDIPDTQPPKIFRIKLYPEGTGSYARVVYTDGRVETATPSAPLTIETTGQGGSYRLAGVQRIEALGRLGFGVETHDYHEASNNRLGAFRIHLWAGDQRLYSTKMDRFSFGETRYINAHVDYAERTRHRRWVQRSFLLPGNRLGFYEATDRGYLTVAHGQRHAMAYSIEDAMGNRTHLGFDVLGVAPVTPVADDPVAHEMIVPRTRDSVFDADGVRVRFSSGTFYEDLPLTYRVAPATSRVYSRRHTVHDPATPVHKSFSISVRADDLPARLRAKALLVRIDDDGDRSSEGGSYSEGFVTARVRTFGTFAVTADTVAPSITPLNLTPGKNMAAERSIRLTIRDNLSGIDSYAGYVDDRWVLFTYDAKNRRLQYTFDEHVPPGRHRLRVVVKDNKGNTGQYEAAFVR